MIAIHCQCGSRYDLPGDFVGEAAVCPECKATFRVVAAGTADLDETETLDARLTIRSGPERIGEQLMLRGLEDIKIGRSEKGHVLLSGSRVSRNHCRLCRTEIGWRLEDLKSKNGVLVNGDRVGAADLSRGDVVRIGDYEFLYSTRGETKVIARRRKADHKTSAPEASPAPETAGGEVAPSSPHVLHFARSNCPSCQELLPEGAMICTACGASTLGERRASRNEKGRSQSPPPKPALRPVTFVMPTGYLPPRVRKTRRS